MPLPQQKLDGFLLDFSTPLKSNHGRGLFIIISPTDHASYLRGQGHNVLHLKSRRIARHPAVLSAVKPVWPTSIPSLAGDAFDRGQA